jgi:uncharacterized protein
VEATAMKTTRAKKKITRQEWFYFGGLAGGCTAALLVAFIAVPMSAPSNHSAKPLEMPGVVPWYSLSKVSYVQRNGKTELEFDDVINRMNGKSIKLRGYITPLQLGRDQKHFILSPTPPSCAFHMPPGAAEMVEIFSSAPVAYSLEPVVISGTLALLNHDPGGIFYLMADAAQVSTEQL